MRGLLGLVLLLLVFSGCSDHGDPTGVDNPPVISGPVSFATDIQPIFDTQCIGCHGAGGNAGLDLRNGLSYDNLVGVAAVNSSGLLVAASDPTSSVLMQRLVGSVGGFMPPAGPLQFEILDLVTDWIGEGALNN